MVVYEIKILFLKINKYGHLSDIARQFRLYNPDIVRHIYKLAVIVSQNGEIYSN